MADPRRCATCASYRPYGAPFESGNGCSNLDARRLGAPPFPQADFGCRFWAAVDPLAYKAKLFDTVLHVLYGDLRNQAGKTRLPLDVSRLDLVTRLGLEHTTLRIVQALDLLP